MYKKLDKVDKKKAKKEYKYREVNGDGRRKILKEQGWAIASKEEKAQYGNKRYRGTDVELMKKEVG